MLLLLLLLLLLLELESSKEDDKARHLRGGEDDDDDDECVERSGTTPTTSTGRGPMVDLTARGQRCDVWCWTKPLTDATAVAMEVRVMRFRTIVVVVWIEVLFELREEREGIMKLTMPLYCPP